MSLKNFKVLANGKIRNVAYEFLKNEVTLFDQQTEKMGKEKFDQLLQEADAFFCVNFPPINEEFLQKAPKLKIVGQFSVGYDHIDLEACRRHNVKVTNTPGVLTDAVADLAYGLLIDSARKISRAYNFVLAGTWGEKKAFGLTQSLANKTLGIIGMGDIGCAIAKRALASKMKIIYHNKHQRADEKNFQATFVSQEELLKTADFVMLACSLNEGTLKLINKNTLDLMKPTAALINISRGKVVDTDALYDALKNKKIAYAALDVTDPEPLPKDHKLLTLDNITITPHMASATKETRDEMAMLVCKNILACLKGEPLLTEVK